MKEIKIWVTGITSILSSPVLLMVLCNLIDYITGLIAAGYRKDGGISSYKSIQDNP